MNNNTNFKWIQLVSCFFLQLIFLPLLPGPICHVLLPINYITLTVLNTRQDTLNVGSIRRKTTISDSKHVRLTKLGQMSTQAYHSKSNQQTQNVCGLYKYVQVHTHMQCNFIRSINLSHHMNYFHEAKCKHFDQNQYIIYKKNFNFIKYEAWSWRSGAQRMQTVSGSSPAG